MSRIRITSLAVEGRLGRTVRQVTPHRLMTGGARLATTVRLAAPHMLMTGGARLATTVRPAAPHMLMTGGAPAPAVVAIQHNEVNGHMCPHLSHTQ